MNYFKKNKKRNSISKTLSLCFAFFVGVAFLATSLIVNLDASAKTSSSKLAVTPAGYDNMGEVLKKLGFNATEIELDDLMSSSTLGEYDVVYINCAGSIDDVAEENVKAIQDYVKNGGFIYASDWANSIIEKAFPGKIKFYKSSSDSLDISENDFESSRVGKTGEVEAKIVDAGLAAVLAKTKIKVNYDALDWAVIDSVGSGSRVLVKGPVSISDYFADKDKTLKDKPFVVTFTEGDGAVLYTTFHNEAQNTKDMENILNWFAVWGKAGKLSQAAQSLASDDGTEVLQEVIDSLNKGETKIYSFGATGKSDFKITLNFGGSALSVTVKDPDGEEIANEKVSSPPYTTNVTAKEGTYEISVKGVDVPEKNYPFVVSVTGDESAMSEELLPTKSSSESTSQPDNISGSTFWLIIAVIVGLGILFVVIIIIVIIVIVKRKKKKKAQLAQSPQLQVKKTAEPEVIEKASEKKEQKEPEEKPKK